uniref:Uncharacterized protein n=1 Tax=Zooxanthella nutricula TaxID=1333877 RepID=A0A7S2VLF1_9DINO
MEVVGGLAAAGGSKALALSGGLGSALALHNAAGVADAAFPDVVHSETQPNYATQQVIDNMPKYVEKSLSIKPQEIKALLGVAKQAVVEVRQAVLAHDGSSVAPPMVAPPAPAALTPEHVTESCMVPAGAVVQHWVWPSLSPPPPVPQSMPPAEPHEQKAEEEQLPAPESPWEFSGALCVLLRLLGGPEAPSAVTELGKQWFGADQTRRRCCCSTGMLHR